MDNISKKIKENITITVMNLRRAKSMCCWLLIWSLREFLRLPLIRKTLEEQDLAAVYIQVKEDNCLLSALSVVICINLLILSPWWRAETA